MACNRDALWRTGRDEPVEVNQRALIDKVLARYSGEFAVFRELLQNSDDAQSSGVEIRFETAAYLRRKGDEQGNMDVPLLPDLTSTFVAQWTFRNNGIVFRDEDWTRLRKIAEGNPDEEKIGAFGVGFYSLFSVTENPFVSSGGHGMQFYWKNNKDQLNVRRGDLPSKGVGDPWTTFEMTLREAAPIPPLFGILRFLASSVTFMTHLNDVSVYFDEHRIGYIKRSLGVAKDVDLPNGLKRSSESKIMNVMAVRSHPIEIEAASMHAVNAVGTAKVTLTMSTAEVDVKLDEKLSAEFLRSTKKRPPTWLKYHLIYTGKAEYDRSLAGSKDQPAACGDIFRGLRADLNGATHTRIFIGHATGQTTGIGGHMASHFIPTVERECIDFVGRNIAIWNKELFATDGTPDLRPPRDLQNRLQEGFLHMLKFFAFHRSTPSPEVGLLLEASFYGCSTAPLRMLSSIGVREASDIKEYSPVFAEFLKDVPMLPQSIIRECESTIRMLQNQGMISLMTFQDVLCSLRQHPLDKEELASCLRWWIGLGHNRSANSTTQLLDVVAFSNVDGSTIPLSSMQHFIDPRTLGNHIPQDCPLPTSILRGDIAMQFTPVELSSFGWREFTVVDWLHYISQPDLTSADPAHDLTRSTDWAARVLSVLSCVWPSTSDSTRCLVKKALASKPCIPTSCGLCTPESSYLPGTGTSLFRDLELPTVQFPNGLRATGDVETFLSFIGVRKHIDPQLVLDRMTGTGNWNTAGLIKYLVQVRKSLTTEEVIGLQSSAIFAMESTLNDTSRYRACDLYAPIEVLRQLQLPVIQWDEDSSWSDDSDEAKLSFDLGLRQYPPLEKIIDLCSSDDTEVRTTAFWYLCDNFRSKYSSYDSCKFGHVAFIPAETNGSYHLAKLGDVFSGTQWKALGFSVVQDDYQKAPTSELGIQQHPPTSMLLSRLEKTPPPNEDTAREWFEILFAQISTFESHELVRLSELPMVPTNSSGVRKWLAPTDCYLGEAQDDFHSKLFVFVNFGSVANRFLSACGSRNEPSTTEVAKNLVDNPEQFYAHVGGHKNFLDQLRNLAVNRHRIPNTTFREMKLKPILLGKKDHDVHELRSPREIVIADDINAYRLFRDAVFIAPQEELVEDFYLSLGCKRLSNVVQEQCKVLDEIPDTKTSLDMRNFVLERLALFLHEYAYAKPKVPVDWLSDAGNFKVKICEKLSISKTLAIGDDETTRSQDASAGAKRLGQRCIELWLSRSYAEPDMYEVSISLCRLLFGTVKVSEALLFTTILSTDLDALRRRGCNVDLILKRRQVEPGDTMKDNERMSHVGALDTSESSPSPNLVDATPTSQTHGTEREVLKSSTSCSNPRSHHPTQPSQIRMMELDASKSSTNVACHVLIQASSSCVSLPEGFDPVRCTPTPTARPTCDPPCDPKHNTPSRVSGMLRKVFLRRSPGTTGTTGKSLQSLWTQQHVIPRSNIRANIDMAIRACKPEEGHLRRQLNNMGLMKESLNDHYCDVSGKINNLEHVGEVAMGVPAHGKKLGVVKVFAAVDVPNLDTFVASKQGPLDRFVNIIAPIAEVYGLSTTSLNIFYDRGGGPIAFNQNGSLFLNLRYFEGWRKYIYQWFMSRRTLNEASSTDDENVKKGVQQQAQISWFALLNPALSLVAEQHFGSRFLTLAHEIAHNLIKSHNSEHAFWFSAICEAHTSTLVQILGPMASR
ncbi:hypothetical protein JVT61DRAFT_2694 [Boletus reticuloceps]|uniref:Sacsin/Nov domain-containing protein n=1 Tax=Boletus reticuloceps TaxID=495285 RepID=A0A8I2YP75_9AGAM|nr:hypothetical protein JVT61DRAFT_2694 [Boletus reticuloceps]